MASSKPRPSPCRSPKPAQSPAPHQDQERHAHAPAVAPESQTPSYKLLSPNSAARPHRLTRATRPAYPRALRAALPILEQTRASKACRVSTPLAPPLSPRVSAPPHPRQRNVHHAPFAVTCARSDFPLRKAPYRRSTSESPPARRAPSAQQERWPPGGRRRQPTHKDPATWAD